ncbi:SusC/RagA family TonB-linked outer membrane protein [Maribacter sp. 2304DJ31-5]|uniref:SusC/RagA family TonB-linked outer membrane protein n=1 Tax=Maribacter sp. 2304DJ31-5 TaxID=3386273 RepID=UPI0039BC3EF6
MKLKSFKTIAMLSRIFVLQLVFCCFAMANEGYTQSIKDVYLEWDSVRQVKVLDVFEEIENQSTFKFNYDEKDVNKKTKFFIAQGPHSVYALLERISKETALNFRRINSTIAVTPRPKKETPEIVEMEVVQKTVSGTVTAASDGGPLPGVSIVVQGTTNGTQTDFDGNYTIEVSEGDVLVFSYLGTSTQSITVGTSNTINVVMQEDASQLDEVVVTALGVKRQKKSLTYATQTVETDGIDEARPQQNLVNSLSGRVAGLSIQRSGNGVSGASKVVLRGNRSIAGSSQPLYVVDGVPLGGDISDISPDDVASINVLKGANAAALYGARANNGAIIITTKSGSAEGFSIDFNATTTVETANILFDYQNQFGQGSNGSYFNPDTGLPLTGALGSWGGALDGSQVANWSPSPDITGQLPYSAQSGNIEDFFQTGINQAYNISVRSGSERVRTFFGYTYEDREGIVQGNELNRHNANFKLDNEIIEGKLNLSARINYIRTNIDNQLATGENFANPLRHVYRLPRNIRTQDIEVFEYVDASGNVRQNYWDPGNNGGANPYWTINRNLNEIINNRVLGYLSLTYNFTDDLSLLARTAVDQRSTSRENRFFNDSYIIADNGNYVTRNDSALEWNTDFLLSYNKQLNDDFAFNLSVGGNHRIANSKFVETSNNGLNAPNIFAISNAQNLSARQDLNRREVNSLYGFGQGSYKDALFLDLTYRSDWSSTLPIENNRFDYYSAGLSAVLSDMMTLPDAISFLKLKANYAEVGNDTSPFSLSRVANLQTGGFIQLSTVLPNADLKPERTQSLEFGFDVRFLDSRLGIDFNYYKSNSIDQLFGQQVPQGSGIATRFINGADIQNKGVEIILTANPIRTTDFNWNITANFTKNDSEVLALADGLETLNFGGEFFRRFELNVGDEWGNIYSRGFARDDQGRALVTDTGLPQVTGGQEVLIGNFNPDWLGGILNSFDYKNFSFSFLIDIRQGGEVATFTNAILASDGALTRTLAGRDGSLVFGQNIFPNLEVVNADGTPNTTAVTAEAFWGQIGGRNSPAGEAFVEDASNIRMREMTFGYKFPQSLLDKTPIKSAKVSFVGRNLFFISNNATVDPEVVDGVGTGDFQSETRADGFSSFAPPATRSLGLNLKIGF